MGLMSRRCRRQWRPFCGAAPEGTTVTTAESCTGGLLAKMFTDVAGSSAYFRQGWVTYANAAKQEMLGVRAESLAGNGAVSRQVVEEMAAGARERAKADYAISISGIAGPEGGTEEKPVGTTWIGLATASGVSARKFVFAGDREMVRDRAAKMGLTLLRYELLGEARGSSAPGARGALDCVRPMKKRSARD